MDSNIKELWRIIYEIEGLILLAEKKFENCPQQLISLLKEKAEIFQSLINNLDSISDCIQLEQTLYEQEIEPNIEDSFIGIEEDEPKCLDIEISAASQGMSEVEETSEINEIEVSIDIVSDEINEEEPINTEIIEEHDSIEVIDDDIEIIELENEMELDPEIETYGTITIEEKLARQNSRDLKQAFTINDRYRFRRELFGNSDTEFIDMINLVSAMTSLAEAEEYFYGDLEWDQENEEVKDFMDIIALYFAN